MTGHVLAVPATLASPLMLSTALLGRSDVPAAAAAALVVAAVALTGLSSLPALLSLVAALLTFTAVDLLASPSALLADVGLALLSELGLSTAPLLTLVLLPVLLASLSLRSLPSLLAGVRLLGSRAVLASLPVLLLFLPVLLSLLPLPLLLSFLSPFVALLAETGLTLLAELGPGLTSHPLHPSLTLLTLLAPSTGVLLGSLILSVLALLALLGHARRLAESLFVLAAALPLAASPLSASLPVSASSLLAALLAVRLLALLAVLLALLAVLLALLAVLPGLMALLLVVQSPVRSLGSVTSLFSPVLADSVVVVHGSRSRSFEAGRGYPPPRPSSTSAARAPAPGGVDVRLPRRPGRAVQRFR